MGMAVFRRYAVSVVVASAVAGWALPSLAQFGAGGGAGVVIDANGVLRMQALPSAALSGERLRAAVSALPADLRKSSPLRKVSLARLEAELAQAAAAGRGIPDEQKKLAGLTRLQYVFVYPAEGGGTGDVVIAGRA